MTRTSCSVIGSLGVDAARPRPRPSPAPPGCAATRRSRRPAAWCTRRRMPAVSTNRQVLPPSSTSSSTGSRVVPATSSTTTRSSPASLLSSEDLPTFGRPSERDPARAAALVARRRPPRPSAAPRGWRRAGRRCPGRAAPETGYGSPRPRFHSSAASASARWSSTLLATRTTGLPARRSSRTTASSVVGGADRGVDDEQHGVGEVDGDLGLLGDAQVDAAWRRRSQPPVSTSVNRRPVHSARRPRGRG